MTRIFSGLLYCAAALLAACSQPGVTPKPLSFQDSATNVRDWDGTAADIARDMESAGLLPGQSPGSVAQRATAPYPVRPMQYIRVASSDPAFLQEAPDPQRSTYYIPVASTDPAFLRELRDALQVEIERHGGIVVARPLDGAMTIDLGVHVVRWGRVPTGVGRWQTWLEQTLVPNMRNEAVWSATFHSATFYVPGREAFLHLRGRFYIWGSDVQLYGSGFQDANIPLRYAR